MIHVSAPFNENERDRCKSAGWHKLIQTPSLECLAIKEFQLWRTPLGILHNSICGKFQILWPGWFDSTIIQTVVPYFRQKSLLWKKSELKTLSSTSVTRSAFQKPFFFHCQILMSVKAIENLPLTFWRWVSTELNDWVVIRFYFRSILFRDDHISWDNFCFNFWPTIQFYPSRNSTALVKCLDGCHFVDNLRSQALRPGKNHWFFINNY